MTALKLRRVSAKMCPLVLARRGGWAVEGAGLENQSIRKGTASSNLALSAVELMNFEIKKERKLFFYFKRVTSYTILPNANIITKKPLKSTYSKIFVSLNPTIIPVIPPTAPNRTEEIENMSAPQSKGR